MAAGNKLLDDLTDVCSSDLESIQKENGLVIQKQRVSIGVIGMIYEARPNVTIDAATLSLKTGNAVILRGSSSAIYSNIALVASIHRALEKSELPVEAVQLIEDTSRETAKELFQLDEYLDVLIPRGGEKLIETVVRESSVPVIKTGAGNCHVFIDASAEQTMAEEIVMNAKIQRPSVCNAIESIIIDKSWFQRYGIGLLEQLVENKVEIIGDESVCSAFPQAKKATVEDWYTEYIDLTVRVKLVHRYEEATEHINQYGSQQSETIRTESEIHAQHLF